MSTATVPKPTPEPDEFSEPFFAGGANGKLMLPRCNDCSTFNQPGVRVCVNCLGESFNWTACSGNGTLHTFGIMHQRYHPGFDAELPYNISVVELEEGPRLNSNIVGCANEDIRVGMKLKVTFERVAEGVYLPKFQPA
jgi:uncharacterized OB-fold protein